MRMLRGIILGLGLVVTSCSVPAFAQQVVLPCVHIPDPGNPNAGPCPFVTSTNGLPVVVTNSISTTAAATATTSAPSYSEGTPNPFSQNLSGDLRVIAKQGSPWTVSLSGGVGSAVTQGTIPWDISGTITANAGTNLNTSLLALESGGNLATLAGGVTSSVYQSNVKQINGTIPLMGNGVTGTGSQRVTIASDNTAFSVNANTNADASVIPGAAPSKSLLGGCQYNATAPTFANGQVGALNCDSDGSLIAYAPDITVTGTIDTVNLNDDVGAATVNSAVTISLDGRNSCTIQIATNTLNNVLTPQVTSNGTNWVTQGGNGLLSETSNTYSAIIGAGQTDIWTVNATGRQAFRIVAQSAVTGSAVATIHCSQGTDSVNVGAQVNTAVVMWGGSTLGAMANYGTSPGAVLVPGVNANVTAMAPFGTTADASCSTATGTCTLLALTKFLNTAVTSPIPAQAASVIIGGVGALTEDGSGNPITSTASALDVNIKSGFGTSIAVTQSTSPWIVAGSGTAGSAATGVMTVQGIASMVPLLVMPSDPVGITPTDRTITSATGASQTVMASNANRHGLIVQNTGNADCGVNPTGGTAAIGGAGTLTLVPNGSYQPRIPTLAAVTAICTVGQTLYAEEN